MSSKSPFNLSRQGTLRSSHRRKNSTAHSLNLNPGKRSPQQLSPSGRRSPVFLMYDGNRSPLDLLEQRKSPTTLFPERRSPTGRRSPLGFNEFDRRSPTSTVHVQDQKSPTAVLLGFDEGRLSPTIQVQGRRSPIGFSQGMITTISMSIPTDKKSPVGQNTLLIPPITVSNPSETCAIIEKTLESVKTEIKSPNAATSDNAGQPQPVPERKEQRSVMREILAFVRKPSKKTTTRNGKFAAAFSRAESNSATPLLRQSTFSSSPAASSRAAKTAVTKQLSEIAFEPKMSLKLLNSKMSFRLRRTSDKAKDKKSSGDEMSDMESSDSKAEKVGSSSSDVPFELENVRFEKVGESYIKHDKIREETLEDASPSPVQIIALSEALEDCISSIKKDSDDKAKSTEQDNNEKITKQEEEDKRELTKDNQYYMSSQEKSVDSIKEDGINMEGNGNANIHVLSENQIRVVSSEHLVIKPEPIYVNLSEIRAERFANVDVKTESVIQCPTFEIMPPSRRSSFDPPRSPFLENLRSTGDTDTELIVLSRLDSGGDSFEMVDTDRNRESSFESRYPSSSHTSFDISKYQSTSYEDQTSSFEIIDLDNTKASGSGSDDKKSTFELRKSSIELVDVETFQKTGCTGRKSSLETHFDFEMPNSRLSTPHSKKQISEPNNKYQHSSNLGMKNHFSTPHRARSPLSNQTSSNYSSHDSYDSSFDHPPKFSHYHSHQTPERQRSSSTDPSKQHLLTHSKPLIGSVLSTDQRSSTIFEPRKKRATSPFLGSHLTSSSEFEPPSPRRAASASPKHTFTFRIVLKKVDSSPDAICPSADRRRSKDRSERLRRRDSRKKRFWETGKSF